MSNAEIWEAFCDETYSAANPPASPPPPGDLLNFSFSLDHIRLEAASLVRLLQRADAAECKRGPTLRAHLPELRHMADAAAALVAEAEREAA